MNDINFRLALYNVNLCIKFSHGNPWYLYILKTDQFQFNDQILLILLVAFVLYSNSSWNYEKKNCAMKRGQ